MCVVLCCAFQMLMCEVSKSVKETLQSTVGCVNAVSFHALVCSQSDSGAAAGHVTQQVPVPTTSLLQQTSGDLVGAEMSTFKAATATSSGIAAIQRMSLPNRYLMTLSVLTQNVTL